MNIFETAARIATRFRFGGQQFTTEQLFQLPLSSNTGRPCLDAIAIELRRELQQSNESFVNPTVPGNTVLQLQFDIVKHVIDLRLAEAAAAKVAREKAAQNARILELIESKQDDALASLSIEELRAKLG